MASVLTRGRLLSGVRRVPPLLLRSPALPSSVLPRRGFHGGGLASSRVLLAPAASDVAGLLPSSDATTTVTTSAVGDLAAAVVPTVEEVLVKHIDKIGDLHASGIASYFTPVGWMQNLLEAVHVTTGLPWWATVVGVAWAFRLSMLPFVLKAAGHTSRMNNIKPLVEEAQRKMHAAQKAGNQQETQKHMKEYYKICGEHNVNPFYAIRIPFMTAPVFMTFFFALQSMAAHPIASLHTEGLLWFQDLTLPDPTVWTLPVISSLTVLLSVELGAEGMPPQQRETMKWFFRAVCAAMIYGTSGFPSLVLTYWCASNFFSLSQLGIMKIPALKARYGIEKQIKWPKKEGEEPLPGFMDSFRAATAANIKPLPTAAPNPKFVPTTTVESLLSLDEVKKKKQANR